MVFAVTSAEQFGYKEVKQAIEAASLRYLGEFGTQKAHPIVMESVYLGNKGVVRVARGSLDDMRLTLAMIKKIRGVDATIRVTGVSGILKKARMKFLISNGKHDLTR